MTTPVLCAVRAPKIGSRPQIFFCQAGNRIEVYVVFDNSEALRKCGAGPPDNLEAARAWAALMMETD